MKFPAGYSVRFSDDGKRLVCLGRNVVLIDATTRQRVWTSHPLSHPSYAAFSPDGALLSVKSTSGRIVVLNTHSGELVCDCMNQAEGEGGGLQFSLDGSQLVDGSWEGSITVRRARDGSINFRQQFSEEMIGRVTHDRTRRIWLFEHSPKARPGEPLFRPGYVSLRRWPFKLGDEQNISFGFDISNATLSPDGQSICLIEKPSFRLRLARVVDGALYAASASFDHGGTGNEIAWSTDGQYVALVQAGKFVFYRAVDLTVAGEVSSQYPSAISFRPNQEDVALGTWRTSTIVPLSAVWQRGLTLN